MDIEEIKKMKDIDVRTVDRAKLMDLKDIEIDPDASPEDKMAEYIKQIKNPYCFLCNGYVIKLEFSETDKTIEDRFLEYISTII